jgi:hypothetical protein
MEPTLDRLIVGSMWNNPGQALSPSETLGRRMSLDPKSVISNPRFRGLDLFPKSKSETLSSPKPPSQRVAFLIIKKLEFYTRAHLLKMILYFI